MFGTFRSALLATGLTLTLATAAPAAVLSFDLFATFLNGPAVGTDSETLLMTISYDDEGLDVDGNGSLNPPDMMIEFLGEGGFEVVDVNYPSFPKLFFVDSVPVAIDFLISSFTFPLLADFGIEVWRVGGEVTSDLGSPDLFALTYDPVTDSYSTGSTVILAPIPLPAGLPLLALGLGAMVLSARRRRARV